MRRLLWGRSAQRDVAAILCWYRDIDSGLADRLIDAIEQLPPILLDHPQIGVAAQRPRRRKWLIRGTPFVLLYVVSASAIEVRRVVDARLDWRRW